MIENRLGLPLTSSEWDSSFGRLSFNSVLKFKYVLIEMAQKNFVSPSIILKFLNQPEFAVNKELSSSLHIQMAYLKKEMNELVNEIERIGLIQSSVSGISASKLNNKSAL